MKTAMQELVDWIEYSSGWAGTRVSKKAQELLEKEKQQIIQAYNDGRDVEDFTANGNRYYTQTYPK